MTLRCPRCNGEVVAPPDLAQDADPLVCMECSARLKDEDCRDDWTLPTYKV